MSEILQFVQTYGVWMALGGAVLLVLSRGGGGMGCCGMSQQQGRGMASGCGQAPAEDDASGQAQRPATVAEARAQLMELQARQEALARQVASLEQEPVEPAREHGPAVRPLLSVGREDARR